MKTPLSGLMLTLPAALGIMGFACSAVSAAPPTYLETPAGAKPRVVITADPELDDLNSLVRVLLYTNGMKIEGLVYASSQFHWSGDGKGTLAPLIPGREYFRLPVNPCPCTSWRWDPHERFIDDAVEDYGKVYKNLVVHDRSYPTPAHLKSKIRWGNVQFDGEMEKDTAGSDLIKRLLLDGEESPVYLHAWGGQSTIARALKSIEDQYKGTPRWAAIRAKVVRKAVIHPSGDQDDTYAKYIKPNWPDIRYREQAGGVRLSYSAIYAVNPADGQYLSTAWTSANIRSRGPLGDRYRVWGDGKQMVKGDVFDYFGLPDQTTEGLKALGYDVWMPPRPKGEFLGEGDTGTYLNLIDNGLRGYRGDSFGGWGGYLRVGAPPQYQGPRGPLSLPPGVFGNPSVPVHPFMAAVQNDFAARLQWSVTARYADANHEPNVRISSKRNVIGRAGQRLTFTAVTSDPDRNAVSLKWWNWPQAGTYAGTVALETRGNIVEVVVPSDAKDGDTIQIVAEASDNGTPKLTRYDKVVITVRR